MSNQIRDLEHRFHIAGRDYVLQVCGCGNHPAPVSAGPSDVVLFECVPAELLDHEDDSPDKIVRDIITHAKQFMPSAITLEAVARIRRSCERIGVRPPRRCCNSRSRKRLIRAWI